ncbi:hypothetical protein [Falsiroseomonas sp.]|uniref:hypothetical protein n=1 Tax=Falsiroseomonas sp. TaxID=2870721 RepID=UPI0034A19CBB
MRRLVTFALLGAFFVSPALAQQQPVRTPAPVAAQQPASPQPMQPVAPAQARAGFGANHALALGIGMFGGAVLGSAMIHGGSFAAAVGAVAGLTAGHWYYTHHGEATD